MTKEQFLNSLSKSLSPLSASEREKTLAYYSEIIDDRMENGMSEEEAVSGFEAPSAIAEGILADANITPPAKKTISPLLLALGSPVWIPLLIAAASVLLALYITLWSLVVAFISVSVSFIAAAIVSVAAFGTLLVEDTLYAFFALGVALFMGGLAVLTFVLIKDIVHGAADFTKRSFTYLTGKLSGKDVETK